ncbi:MAG: RNA polymerase factor sigma-54 [Paracoccaceae bacterium]
MKPRNPSSPQLVIKQTQRMQLNLGLAASIRVLRMDGSGLTRYLEELAAENPHIRLDRPEMGEWLPRWSGAFAPAGTGGHAEEANAAPSLMAHVMAGIDRVTKIGRERHIAHTLAEALEPSGWIGWSLSEIATSAGASVPEVEAVLVKLQQIEPTGLFARSLAECLMLQAAESGCLDRTMRCILGHLDLLAMRDFARLATLCEESEAEIMARLRLIRGFDPKPGAQFEAGAAPLREPDLVATKGEAGWQVVLNRSALPALSLQGGGGRDKTPQARADWAAARAVEQMVQTRNATLLRVGAEILRRQEAALEQGQAALVPLTMADVAEAVGLHESTISRIVAGTAVDTPLGTWWLRHLFSARLGPEGNAVSGAALRAALARLVGAEDSGKPLSDQALVDALAAGGMEVARRTVAKYREALQIPPVHRRRRRLSGSTLPVRDRKGRIGG